jgi:hypothetical protein
LETRGGWAETMEIPAPENIGAYSRALVVNVYAADALEKFAGHPELEGERQMMDVCEPDLEM